MMHFARFVLVTTFVSACSGGSVTTGMVTAPPPIAPGLPTMARGELPEVLDSLLTAALTEFGVPGMAAAVSNLNGDIISAAVGMGIRGMEMPVTVSSRFHIASVMKPMTATAIATSVEQGLLRWESTPAEVFPEFVDSMAPAMRDVTIAQLLSHTAGVQPFTSGAESQDLPEFRGTALQRRLAFTKFLLSRPPAVPPGTRYVYSNAGYRIAAAMLERVESRPFEVLIQERVWGPLAMTTSGFGWPAREHSTAPWGHYQTPFGLLPHPPTGGYALDPELGAPHGDVHMSIEDLARFGQLHLAGLSGRARLLQEGTFRRMHQVVPPASYGLGWAVVPRATRARPGENASAEGLIEFTTSEHDGTAGTFFASLLVSPSRGVAIAVVANADNRAAVEWVRDRIHQLFR
jgi:CubicO group peptidase (beta-lactamase class C family)